MEMEQVLHMNGGDGKTSYAKNSTIQKQGMHKAKPILEDSIKTLYCNNNFPKCFKIADLGCSSGPNTLSFVREIVDVVDDTCRCLNRKAPVFQVFLNDLPGNDFNAVFRSLPSFTASLMEEKGSNFGPCFVAAMPGSFYGRLFPNSFLHFVHSSYSLHWRSRVPESLVSKSPAGAALNKGNICMAKTSPHDVHKAYFDVFERDFKLFLRSRFQEMVPGGHMVLTVVGSDIRTPSSKTCTVWELMGMALYDMVLEGLIEEAKLDGFNLPYYAPTPEEVKRVIQTEGSFKVRRFETYKIDWDANSENGMRGENVARNIRAVAESILGNHFTNLNMDDLFERFAKKITEYLEKERGQCTTIAVSLIKA
ncbi:jasmonic acid carboxyl methyltransferase [Hibiscus trionum]|uniref:Jasmonic acid carboxyl methyltransferase n=1 Tax=Hibiscus trionum TaxID=183268 RepID=A0A9W7JDU3_HIBTR|nr:jasmonic acid carboxyl methyltransferase [Hibiscus trionum]